MCHTVSTVLSDLEFLETFNLPDQIEPIPTSPRINLKRDYRLLGHLLFDIIEERDIMKRQNSRHSFVKKRDAVKSKKPNSFIRNIDEILMEKQEEVLERKKKGIKDIKVEPRHKPRVSDKWTGRCGPKSMDFPGPKEHRIPKKALKPKEPLKAIDMIKTREVIAQVADAMRIRVSSPTETLDEEARDTSPPSTKWSSKDINTSAYCTAASPKGRVGCKG